MSESCLPEGPLRIPKSLNTGIEVPSGTQGTQLQGTEKKGTRQAVLCNSLVQDVMEHPKKFVLEGGWTSLEADCNDSKTSMAGRVGLTVPRTE